ncbi:MAG: hypothetical protein ACRC4M_04415 [Mycoplasma sp.]
MNQNNSAVQKAAASSKIRNPQLPEGFDVIDTYQNHTEQALVDNLFDYFGKVYYTTSAPNGVSEKINGKYFNIFDAEKHKTLSKYSLRSLIKFIILGCIFATGLATHLIFFTLNFDTISSKAEVWSAAIHWDYNILLYLIYASWIVVLLFGIFTLVSLVNSIRYFIMCQNHDKKVANGYQSNIQDKKAIKNYPGAERIRNKAVSKYDEHLFALIKRKFWSKIGFSAFCLLAFIGGVVAWFFLIGSNLKFTVRTVQDWADASGIPLIYMEIIVGTAFALLMLLALTSIILFLLGLNWQFKKTREASRVKEKVNQWNQNYTNFANNLTSSGIKAAIQTSITDLIFDKGTPLYDKKTFNLHNRIYTYSSIPQDAHRIEFKNLSSGFYKGSPFNVSYSKWEWFREAKVIDQKINKESNVITNSVSRSLKRFEDSICVVTIETFAEPKLNFVLNNPDGRNLRLQNSIFNDIFSLAVNNQKLAYKIFTPYVQHTLSRCKTWSGNCKSIRQVIKEGSKLHVVLDGKDDFFNFDVITNPELNHIFRSKDLYFKNVVSGKPKAKTLNKRLKFGSLDDSAALMTEYIFEELDVLISALEMGACLPVDNSLRAKPNHKTLYDVLEEKRLAATNQNAPIVDITTAPNQAANSAY